MPVHGTRPFRSEKRQDSKSSSPFAPRPFLAEVKQLSPEREAIASRMGRDFPPVQRQGPTAGNVVQRYITDEEGVKMSYSEVWDEVGEAVDGTYDEATLNDYFEQDEPFKLSYVIAQFGGPEEMVPELTPVEKIQAAELSNPIVLQNSRAKKIFLFDSEGNPTISKANAVYMVDTAMDEVEYTNYLKVEKWGVRVPRIFGLKDDFPIVQWLPKQITVGGAGGRPLWPAVKQSIFLDSINKRPFNKAKWKTTLSDVNDLIGLNYSSPDLQFMIDEDSGHIYIMDLESNNAPVLLEAPDRRLIDLRGFLLKTLEENSL